MLSRIQKANPTNWGKIFANHISDKRLVSRLLYKELLQLIVKRHTIQFQFRLVTQSHLTLCEPTDCSMPGFPTHHQLPELAQTHVHRVGDAIQPSHLLSSPSPPAFNLSQHQGLFQ